MLAAGKRCSGRWKEQRTRLSEGQEIPDEFSRPEVLKILRGYYASIAEGDKVEVELHSKATGDDAKK